MRDPQPRLPDPGRVEPGAPMWQLYALLAAIAVPFLVMVCLALTGHLGTP